MLIVQGVALEISVLYLIVPDEKFAVYPYPQDSAKKNDFLNCFGYW